MMKRLIKAGANPNSPFGRENPLYEAASRGQNETVAILVEQGAVVDPDDGYRTPFAAAAIEAGHEWGQTALIEAAYDRYEATVALLLELGARTEEKDDHGRVPLWIATKNRHMNTVKLLVKYGANIEAADHYGSTPLTVVVRYGDRKLAEYPLETDDQERNQQVAVMGEIYRAASSVIMWLGEEIGAIQTASDLLPRVARAQRTLLQEAGDLLVEEGPAEGGEDPKTLLERMFEEQNATEAFEHLMQRTNIWPPEIFNSHIVADSGPQAEILFEDVVFILHTLEQVFVHAVRYMIEVCGIAWVWRLGIQRKTKKSDNLPSWVPDLNERSAFTEVSPFRDGKSSFKLDIKEDSMTTETPLRISGCIVDKIVFKLTLTRDLEILTILSLVVDALANNNRGIYDTYPIGEGFDVNNNVARSEKERVNEGSSMKSTNAMALFATITYFDEETKGTTTERVLPPLAGWLIWTLSMNTNTPGLSKTAPEYAERFAEQWTKESGDDEAFVDFELENLKLVEDVLKVGKYLIYTENGYFGLINPEQAEVGMVLAMVGRAHTLRLLRKKDDTTSFYAYVDMVFLNTTSQEVDKVERTFRDIAPERLEIR
ncbi:hypothetical protein FLAG1_07518 [Fusarium langsethiae]|uniref:Heterokaryon incompatibility domain-containing protein n=1 Tax=Fusarium langsethiae TaxID=179993 RepID=A0A0M9EU05_FUSLA|nr:hypothetical protein FLAG1_07518 [Fusarium langsethiae]